MKIGLVSLARRGGMVHFLAELANPISRLAQTSVVLSSAADASYFGPRVERIPINTGRGSIDAVALTLSPWTWYGLFRQLRGLRIDVLHVAGIHEWNPGVVLCARLLGKPVVYTVHDPDAHPGAPLALRLADGLSARMADAVVVLTSYGRDRLTSKGIAGRRISVIPHPMYTLFRRWRIKSKRPSRVILSFGRLEAYKGLEHLLAAFASIRRSLPRWRLVIAGSGRLPHALETERIDGVKIMHGYVSDRDVAALMQEASIVAVPYTSASQSGVIALAQAFGKPVVAGKVGGLGEMVVDGVTGLLVPPRNDRALASALKTMASDGRRRSRMRRAVAAQGKEQADPSKIARAHMRLYERLHAERRGQ